MRVYLSLICAVVCLSAAVDVRGQSIEWVGQVQRMIASDFLGYLNVEYDKTRGRLGSVGWEVGTILRSDDSGKTWYGHYLYVSDVVKKEPVLRILDDGTWFYQGLTPWNARVAIISDDGGDTWHYMSSDTTVYYGDYPSVVALVPPHAFLSYDRNYQPNFTLDAGKTWRKYPLVLPDSGQNNLYRYNVGNHVVYYTGRGFLRRFDLERDSVPTRTKLPSGCRPRIESGTMVVGDRYYSTIFVQPHPDSVPRFITEVHDPVGDTLMSFYLEDIIQLNDSVGYAVTSEAVILKINLKTGEVSFFYRTNIAGEPFKNALIRKVKKYGDQILVRIYDARARWVGPPYHSYMNLIIEGDSVVVKPVIERASFLTGVGSEEAFGSYDAFTFLGDIGLFMINHSWDIREIVRTTDLGTTWNHPEDLDVPLVPKRWMPMRNALLTTNKTLLMQSNYDHLFRTVDDVDVEIRQYATDRLSNERSFAKVYHRHPTIGYDQDRLLSCLPFLCELNPETGAVIDTILPRRASFMKRISESMLIAGRDSLWLSFNNGASWAYEDAGLNAFPDTARGSISDAVRGKDGKIYCALRGVHRIDTFGVRRLERHGGVSRSKDGGSTWQHLASWPQDCPHVTTLAALTSGTILAAASDVEIDERNFDHTIQLPAERVVQAGLYRSTNGGDTWTKVYTDYLSNSTYPDLERAIVQMPNGNIIATTLGGTLINSTDDGITWSVFDILALGDATVNGLTMLEDGTMVLSTSVGVARFIAPGFTSVQTGAEPITTSVSMSTLGTLTIQSPGVGSHVCVTSLDGRLMLEQPLSSPLQTIDASSLATGAYIVTVTSAMGDFGTVVMKGL